MGEWFIGKIHFDHKNKNSIKSLQINQYSIIPPFHYSIFHIKNDSLKSNLFFRIVVYTSTLQIDEFFDFRCNFLRTVNHMGFGLG